MEELKKFSNIIEDDVYKVLTIEGSVEARDHFGGTAPEQIKIAVQAAREKISNLKC
jgi:argininosuccinate lyase